MNSYSFRGKIGFILIRLFSLFPIKPKVVFMSFDGTNYGDNPYYIYLEMKKKYGDKLKYIWLLKDKRYDIPGAKVVKAYSVLSIYHLATARIWICNTRLRAWVYKRKKQFYVQTWHGGIALKKIEKDAYETLPKDYIADAIHDSKIADLFVSGSRWNTNNYKDAFWYSGMILENGFPRSDIFYKDNRNLINNIKNELSIQPSDKVALYAPTFRKSNNLEIYSMNYHLIIDNLQERFGGKWKIIIRLHPGMSEKFDNQIFDMDILDGSKIGDINSIIVASDLVISDYSSCIFDAMEANINTLIYAPDYDEYIEERGLYFDLENLPCPISYTFDDLLESIKIYDEDKYELKKNGFLTKLGLKNSSHSTEDFIEYLSSKVIDNFI